jgi:beta-galactosidase
MNWRLISAFAAPRRAFQKLDEAKIGLGGRKQGLWQVMWSGEYSSWEQIIPPLGSYPDAWLNPSYMLDFNRYASDSVITHINWQAALIRKNIPHAKLTTNVWFCRNMPNFYDEFKNLDFISYDNYPTTRIPDNEDALYSHAFHLDLMRGVKQDKFWVMEQLSGGLGCWSPMSRTTSPGMIKGYALQAFAHGADTVVQFRWRTAAGGAEMHWHGLIDHSNVPGRRFAEFEQLCETAKGLKDAADTGIKSEVAILYSPEDEYAFKIQPQTGEMYYLEQLMLFHRAFTRCGINVDIVSSLADLSNYRLVVAPQMYVTHPVTVAQLHAFAQNGGTVILTNRSGVKMSSTSASWHPCPGLIGIWLALMWPNTIP